MDDYNIIVKPLVTEQGMHFANAKGAYSFEVNKKANKLMVMRAVSDLFKVRATSCRIINVRGKVRNNRAISRASFRRGQGRTAAWKKAMVTLDKGQSIDTFEGA